MESSDIVCDMNMLINVLMQGYEHVKELEAWLVQPCSAEACKTLASKAESSFTEAISIARLLEQDSPRSSSSEKAGKEPERKQMSKKRKSLPSWSRQVRASSGSAMEAPAEDGYSWRKYGQKDILGAKFPRGYYRCTYRHSHGCLATKQVQLSDDDSSVFDVTYRGNHTCNHNPNRSPLPSPKEQHISQQIPSPTQHQLLQIFRTDLRVKTEDLSSNDRPLNSSPPSFPSTPTPASCVKPDSNSPTFVSATTSSESNYFFGVNNLGGIDGLDSDIAEIISETMENLTTNSSLVGVDFPMDHIWFDAEFPYDFS